MKKSGLVVILSALLFSSCESSQQMSGVYLGGMLGGVFGSSIGGLAGGPRGSDAGTALGMIIGGAAGAAVTAPKDKGRTSSDGYSNNESQEDEVDAYNRHSHKQGRTSTYGQSTQDMANLYDNLQIENLRFVDENNNRSLDVGERAKIMFEIRNNGSTEVFNVTPVLSVTGTKQILISPTAIISSIAPGKTVRYTAELYGKKKLKRGIADFTLSFAKGQTLYTVRTFQLNTGSNNV